MADGWGYFIQGKYGEWDDGPDEDELRSIGLLGGKAKEVLRAAYVACRHAVGMAPRLDRGMAVSALEITQQYNAAREAAMAREELREHRDSDAEYTRPTTRRKACRSSCRRTWRR